MDLILIFFIAKKHMSFRRAEVMYMLSFSSSFECFYVFCFRWEIYENSSSWQDRRQQEVNESCSFYWALTIQRLTVMVGRELLIVILLKLWGLITFSIETSSCYVCYELHEWAFVYLCLQKFSNSSSLVLSWSGGNVSNQIKKSSAANL